VTYLLESGAKSYYSGSDQEKDRSPVFLAIRSENEEILRAIFLQLSKG